MAGGGFDSGNKALCHNSKGLHSASGRSPRRSHERFLGFIRTPKAKLGPKCAGDGWLGSALAESGVRKAECGKRKADCGKRTAECGKRPAECGQQPANPCQRLVFRHSLRMPDQLVEAGAEVIEQVFELRVFFVGQFQDRLAFPGRSQCDVEEPHLFAPGSLAASFRQIECDRERGPLEMISCAAFEPEAAGFAVELFCELEGSRASSVILGLSGRAAQASCCVALLRRCLHRLHRAPCLTPARRAPTGQ